MEQQLVSRKEQQNTAKVRALMRELSLRVPLTKARKSELSELSRSWATLHPALAKLQADEQSLNTLAEMLYVELEQEDGPRPLMVDRIYKRMSNLRRIYETQLIYDVFPELLTDGDQTDGDA